MTVIQGMRTQFWWENLFENANFEDQGDRRVTLSLREIRKAYKILVGMSEGKRPLGRWENNIRIDIREIGWKLVDWIHLAQNRY
jgi:hypothetical protein